MTTFRCSICANKVARGAIDPRLDEGMTAAGISRMLEGIGATVSQEVISRHRKHYRDDQPIAPKGTRKTDLAILVRDRAIEQFEGGELDLTNKEHAPGIAAGLKAQSLLDGREKLKAKTGRSVELLSALFALIGGEPMAQIEDGNTIEGEYEEVGDDGGPE